MATYYSDMVNRPTCVYRAYDPDGQLLYVGLSMNPNSRFAKHTSSAWWQATDEITIQWFEGREAAKEAERVAILTERPLFNLARPAEVPRFRVVQ